MTTKYPEDIDYLVEYTDSTLKEYALHSDWARRTGCIPWGIRDIIEIGILLVIGAQGSEKDSQLKKQGR
ncbi:MAG: hypothetical protein K8F52_14450 [Candidatus Scalindua rubra]|uniref:Uncharacterized protein n=1 Tax=Candidatus Scalindua brodae TaxID=237368 RepID=A0A0B0ES58_9BACT|nr:MAG: hypothetical protein SCABRO_00266 [Candidatus Scalindua brodae]MBZ0109850.1 hypothetical protein [Candidatus Scalindua rubra]TWU33073.1 hypothetical protein S225a_15230 [Candidatus Brocadiaceae bacterium S225]